MWMLKLILLLTAHLRVGILAMPGKRSMEAWNGWRRARDMWYATAHSAPNKKFIEVDRTLAPAVKAMASAKALHSLCDHANGFASHYARNASLSAAADGRLSKAELATDLKTYSAGNRAKHDTAKHSWAEAFDDDEYDSRFPPLSGCIASISPPPVSGN